MTDDVVDIDVDDIDDALDEVLDGVRYGDDGPIVAAADGQFYRRDQKRIPKGQHGGGRFADEGVTAATVAAERGITESDADDLIARARSSYFAARGWATDPNLTRHTPEEAEVVARALEDINRALPATQIETALSDLRPEVASALAQAATEFADQYPLAASQVVSLGVEDTYVGRPGEEVPNKIGAYVQAIEELFNPSAYVSRMVVVGANANPSDLAATAYTWAHQPTEGEPRSHVGAGSLVYTFRHEFGHVVHQREEKRADIDGTGTPSDEGLVGLWDPPSSTDPWWEIIHYPDGTSQRPKVRQAISGYAQTNQMEFSAEVWAMAHANGRYDPDLVPAEYRHVVESMHRGATTPMSVEVASQFTAEAIAAGAVPVPGDICIYWFEPPTPEEEAAEIARIQARPLVAAGGRDVSGQPRVPAGSPEGGQWTETGGTSTVDTASGRRLTILYDGTEVWGDIEQTIIPASNPVEAAKKLVAIYNHDLGNGVRSEVQGVSAMGVDVGVEGALIAANGEWVGTFSRVLNVVDGDLVAGHGGLEIFPDQQGQGIGSAFNAATEAEYRKLGVDRIELVANVDVGGYAWARAGYDWDPDPDGPGLTEEVIRYMDDMAERAPSLANHPDFEALYDRAYQVSTGEATEDYLPTPFELSRVGWTPGAEMWLGKQVMLGTRWHGVKRLRPKAVVAAGFRPDQPRDWHGRWTDGLDEHGNRLRPPDLPAVNPAPADPQAFHDRFERSMANHPRTAFVNHYTVDEIAAMSPFMNETGTAGVIVHDHGDGRVEATGLWAKGGPPGSGLAMLDWSIEHQGVNYVECFGKGLRKLYESVGFVVESESPFNDEYAPEGWDYETNGRPPYFTLRLPPREPT